jgi:hypothetical protein
MCVCVCVCVCGPDRQEENCIASVFVIGTDHGILSGQSNQEVRHGEGM